MDGATPIAEPRPFLWSAEAYYQACEAGLFLERRVQLIDGEIIEMAAQKNTHALGVGLAELLLQQAFGPNFWVRSQMTLDLSPHSAPDPDIAVVTGGIRSYIGKSNPTTAVLILEVSDTTLAYDRRTKASLYAASGIADYWILNLIDRQLEVYRDPKPDPKARLGWSYASSTDLLPGATVTPLALPGVSLPVADLIP